MARIASNISAARQPNLSLQTEAEVPSSTRPFDDHLFWVEIEGIAVAGFSACSAVSMETEVFEYREGGLNTHTLKFPVGTKFNNITLKRGIDSGKDLYLWYKACLDGKGIRKNISIIQFASKATGSSRNSLANSPITEVRRYDLARAFPIRWTGPELKTDSGSTAIESLEFAFEGLNIVNSPR